MMALRLNNASLIVLAAVTAGIVFVLERFVQPGPGGSLLVTMTFWLALSEGVVTLFAAAELSDGNWQRPLQSKMLGAVNMIPVAGLLFLVQATELGAYPWIDEHGMWLNKNFFVIRHIVAIAVMFMVGRRLATGILRGARNMRVWAVVYILFYVAHLSMIGFEWLMSLEKPWFSTLFGAWIAVGGFLSGICMCAIIVFGWRRRFDAPLRNVQKSIGGLMFGFATFWAYFYFSQLIVIWYGNLPEEVSFLAKRIGYHTEYWHVARLIFGLCWVVPFFVLLGRKPKATPSITLAMALTILTGLFLEYWLVVTVAVHVNIPLVVIEMALMAFAFASIMRSSDALLPSEERAVAGAVAHG